MDQKQIKMSYKENLKQEAMENPRYAKGRMLAYLIAIAALLLRLSDYLVSYLAGYGMEFNMDYMLTLAILLLVTKLIIDGYTIIGGIYYLYSVLSMLVQIAIASYFVTEGESASLKLFFADTGIVGYWMLVICIGCLIFGVCLLAVPEIREFRLRVKQLKTGYRKTM